MKTPAIANRITVNRNRARYLVLKIFIAALCIISAALYAEPDEPFPSADKLLRDVIAQLPEKPLTISGRLLIRRRRGIPVASYNFQLDARWGANPPQATYTISDNFGRPLQQLTIIHSSTNTYHYSTGNPLHPAKLRSLATPIRDTDLSWMDLTLSFLWWRGGKVIGTESVKTVDCYIIKINAPHGQTAPYASAKLWIAKKNHMMLQAEGFDAKGKLLRKLWVLSGKKMDNGEWMIKNMEIQKYPAIHRTKLQVLDVTTQGGLEPPDSENKANKTEQP